jgi:hypothetical protein
VRVARAGHGPLDVDRGDVGPDHADARVANGQMTILEHGLEKRRMQGLDRGAARRQHASMPKTLVKSASAAKISAKAWASRRFHAVSSACAKPLIASSVFLSVVM